MAYNGQLNQNKILFSSAVGALYNMIISQEVFSDNIKGTFSTLVDKNKSQTGLFGDTALVYAADILQSYEFNPNDTNVLELNRPDAPQCQAITIDVFRQINLTLGDFLVKQAFSTEGTYSQFQSVMTEMINETKKVYTSTTYNVYAGTTKSEATKNTVEVALSDISATGEEKNRLEAQMIAQTLADLFVDLNDVSRDYNDYGFLRSYDNSDFYVVWNSAYKNKITKMDLPTIFGADSLKADFEGIILPSRYFGELGTEAKATATTGMRSVYEADFATAANAAVTHVFAGDVIPTGTKLVTAKNANGTAKTVATIPANAYYTVNDDIICKVIHKKAIPFMEAISTQTEFNNPKNLTRNLYLTFGHNTLTYLKNYPVITVEAD